MMGGSVEKRGQSEQFIFVSKQSVQKNWLGTSQITSGQNTIHMALCSLALVLGVCARHQQFSVPCAEYVLSRKSPAVFETCLSCEILRSAIQIKTP